MQLIGGKDAMRRERKGHWMQTFSGKQFWPIDPREDEIFIEDIAHATSHQCRYGGHCKRFYSVAEHLVHCSHYAPAQYQLEALMHDASEGYLVDVPRPIKRHLAGYYDYEKQLEIVIARRFQLVHPWPEEVMLIDNRILLDERDQNMCVSPANKGDGWPDELKPLGVKIECWPAEVAEIMFLARFRELMEART